MSKLLAKNVANVVLDRPMLAKLERLSGLRFKNIQEIKDLQEDICLANKLFEIHTEGIQPLYSITEEYLNCPLREDVPGKMSKEEVLQNAPSVLEDFFATPKANVLLTENKLFETLDTSLEK